jgi:hypothetical protein
VTILPAALRATAEEPLAEAQTSAQRVGVDEVGESALPVDLDHGKELPVARLELGSPGDVDELELEAELGMYLLDDLDRTVAEAAVCGVVDPDRYGYRPRVVVASATRCTASPYDAMRRLVP